MSDAKLTSNELVAELLEVAKQVVRECESCYGKGERKHTFTGQMIACSKCADAKKAIARASSEQKSGKCADEASRDLRAPMPKGSLPNSLGNEHLYEPDQEWMNAPLGEHSAHEPPVEVHDPDDLPIEFVIDKAHEMIFSKRRAFFEYLEKCLLRPEDDDGNKYRIAWPDGLLYLGRAEFNAALRHALTKEEGL